MASLASFQLINKILQEKDYGIIRRNSLDTSYFPGYEDEFKFIEEHYKKFGNIPDTLTFAGNFPNFDFAEVYETEDYLIDKLHEEYGFQKFNQILPEVSKRLQGDSRDAYNFLIENLSVLKPHTVCKGIDIIADFDERYQQYINRMNSADNSVISTGLPELDDVLGGWEYGEELVTITGRTCTGKSWLLMKFLSEAWKLSKTVGLYSGEMSHIKLGYRFDALFGNVSNKCLNRGIQLDGYKEYGENLKENKTQFRIITQKEFGGRPSVQQIRNFIEENNIEIMGIDQLSLMEDSRAARNEQTRIKLAHISEDLFALSSELKIPILALAQANRDSLRKDSQEAPGLDNIKESDDIAHNSSKCIGMRQYNGGLILEIIKNRGGRVGDKLYYTWDIDCGNFSFVPSDGDKVNQEVRNKANQRLKEEKQAMISAAPF